MFLGLVEMMLGLVYASFSLPECQALKITFFTPSPNPNPPPSPPPPPAQHTHKHTSQDGKNNYASSKQDIALQEINLLLSQPFKLPAAFLHTLVQVFLMFLHPLFLHLNLLECS